MVLASTTAKAKLDSSSSKTPPHPAGRKGAVEAKDTAEPGAKLADLCDEDKAKVARLINQVLLAFREIHRLRDLLEEEEKANESITSKLREQNQEMATEISQLRHKLATVQNLLSPLQLHKVFLQADKTAPSLTPIRETDIPEVGFQVTAMHADCSDLRNVSTLEERICSQLLTPTEIRRAYSVGVEEDGSLSGNFPKSDVENHSGPRGKENQDPEVIGCGTEAAESDHLIEHEVLPQKRRPLPRPLPDLVIKILHTHKEVTSSTPLDSQPIKDSTVNTPGQEQESTHADGEHAKYMALALERSSRIDTECPPRKLIQCPDVAFHTYYEESDESLVSGKSKKKMRFDPTAGEEGEFFYASDSTVFGNIQGVPVHQAGKEYRRVQSQKRSVDITCTRCSKPYVKKKGGTDCDKDISRHSFHEVASTENDTIPVNQQKKEFPGRGGPGNRDEYTPTLVYTTDEDDGPDSSSRTRTRELKDNQCLSRERISSNLCSKYVHLCAKCASPFVSKLPKHGQGKKESNERERRSKGSLTSPRWKTVETEEDSEENNESFHSRIPSSNRKIDRCQKHSHQTGFSKGVKPLGRIRRKGNRDLITGPIADEKTFEPRTDAYNTTGEDSDLSSQRTADFTNDSKERSLLVQPMSAYLHERRAGARDATREEIAAIEDEADQSSELKTEVFHVNHEIVDSLLLSETENSESFKCSSLVDEKVIKLRGDHIRLTDDCRASADGRLELGSTVALTCPPQTDVEVNPVVKSFGETPIKLPKDYCKGPRPKRWIHKSKQTVSDDDCAQEGDMESEKPSFNVEDLLGRFIRSNEECAAELIKCFQSKAGTSHAKGSDYSERIPNQKAVPEGKAKESEEIKSRDCDTCHMHLSPGKTTMENFTRCTGCLAVLKHGASGSANKNGLVVNDTEVMCGKCSTSRAILKNPRLGIYSQEGGPNLSPESITKLGEISTGSLTTDCMSNGQYHEMFPAADEANARKLVKTDDPQIGLFDVSLFQLVTDLEVEETEYWNQINSPATGIGIKRYDTRSRKMGMEKHRASTMGGWCHPKRNTNVKNFR